MIGKILPQRSKEIKRMLLLVCVLQVELREDSRVIQDLANGGARADFPYKDVMDITDTWR